MNVRRDTMMRKTALIATILLVCILAFAQGAMAASSTASATLDASQTSAIQITVSHVPPTLTLVPGATTTNSATEYFVNSSSDWQVAASDLGANALPGFMYNYSVANTAFQTDHLNQPFKVFDSGSVYTALSAAPTLKTGTTEESLNTYNLGISQDVKYADAVLPGTNVYRIVVTLTATNIA